MLFCTITFCICEFSHLGDLIDFKHHSYDKNHLVLSIVLISGIVAMQKK